MAKIRINFSSAQSANSDLQSLIRQMQQLESDLSGLKRHMDPEIQSRHRIEQSLKSACSAASVARAKATRLHGVVSNGISRYHETEVRLNAGVPDNRKV
jgi:hypothetical protein